LLGTTRIGGGVNQGTIFRLRKDGTQFATVRSFNGIGGEGARLRAPLLQTAGGVFYGTTFGGGTGDQGVLFRLFTPNLIPAPTLATQPRSVIGAPGSTVTFTAAANGSQFLRYQWLHLGTNIPGAFSPSLTLPAVDANKIGEYKVRVTGFTGEVTSQPAHASLFSITRDRSLLIEGTPGNNYRIETAQSLGSPTVWTEMTNIILGETSATIPAGNSGARFFRTVLVSP
jgi:hypothetical protein